ncbi:hypothetical protein X975_04264, partial [Stegodyphus mimosarum]
MPGSEGQTIDKYIAAGQEPQILYVAVKIPPPLWKKNVKLWFPQVESNFALAKISKDITKYNHVISSIDSESQYGIRYFI